MPRSTNPSNYEEMYWDLLQGMEGGIPEITLNVNANVAQKVRYNFYAFIRALEVQGERKVKANEIIAGQQLQTQANTMRGYLVNIEVNGHSVSRIDASDKTPAKLRFINRDLNPETQTLREQIKEQLRDVAVQLDELPTLTTPPVDSFFKEKLEITDDLPGDNEEVQT